MLTYAIVGLCRPPRGRVHVPQLAGALLPNAGDREAMLRGWDVSCGSWFDIGDGENTCHDQAREAQRSPS